MRPVADVVRRRSLLPTESIARKDAGDDKERERGLEKSDSCVQGARQDRVGIRVRARVGSGATGTGAEGVYCGGEHGAAVVDFAVCCGRDASDAGDEKRQ